MSPPRIGSCQTAFAAVTKNKSATTITDSSSSVSFHYQGNSLSTNGEKKQRTDAVLDQDEGEQVNVLWDVVHEIPTDEEKAKCDIDRCTGQVVATWSTNIDPEDK